MTPSFPTRRASDLVAGFHGGRIVAGAVANRTDDVVGLSNVFTPAEGAVQYWAGCVAGAIAAFPGLPLVDYERGPDLELARETGRSEEHTSELQSLMRISYAVFCLKKQTTQT